MDDHQAIWDGRYEKALREKRTLSGEPWIEDWLHLVPRGECLRALDVGCGAGHNTLLLLKHGFKVTAVDFAESALEMCRREAPEARVEMADVRQGLPFPDERFELIVADLSLHYFHWDRTVAIIDDVASRLVPGGLFAGRFNSTGDTNHGAGNSQPVPGEPNLFTVRGIEKRFFTKECCHNLFAPPWTIVSLQELTTHRFARPKTLWQLLATPPS